MSFSLGFTAEREYNLDEWREEIKRNIREGNLSVIKDEAVQHEDRYYTQKIMGTPVYQRLGETGLWYKQPNPEERFINHYQLEGSFYPSRIIQRLSDFLSRTKLREILPDVNYFTGEIWIPCYLLKHETEEVLSAAFVPPVIARYRDFRIRNCCIIGSETLHLIVFSDKSKVGWYGNYSAFDSIYGIKYQRPHLEAESALLYLDTCAERNAESCKKKIPYQSWLTVDNFLDAGCERDENFRPIDQFLAVNSLASKLPKGSERAEMCKAKI